MGAIVNFAAIVLAGLLGLLIKKGISEKISSALMNAMGLCVAFIGISGMLKGAHALITVVSLALGTVIGTVVDLDKRVNSLAYFVEKKLNHNGGKIDFASGFITATLLFCIGAMSIVGSLNSGLKGDNTMLYTKSLLDMVSATIYSSAMGVGVAFSAIPVLLLEGGITLLSQYIAPFLSDLVINEITCVGSILILALSLNMLKITEFKVINFMPAVFLPILLCKVPFLL